MGSTPTDSALPYVRSSSFRTSRSAALSPCLSLPPKSNSRAPGLRRSSRCAATQAVILVGCCRPGKSFGVDSYAQYMTAVSTLQKTIMGDAANIQPELLATTVFSHQAPDPGEAVGSVYALHAIADGATLAHALDKLGVDDPEISQAVKASYESMIGEDDRRVPSQQQRQDAKDRLHGFHLSRAWFRG